jgi:hypothetical protein
MQLMMYIGNDLIEAVPVNFSQFSQPGYLGKFKRVLKQKYSEMIQESGMQPEFLVIDMKSSQRASNTYSNNTGMALSQ